VVRDLSLVQEYCEAGTLPLPPPPPWARPLRMFSPGQSPFSSASSSSASPKAFVKAALTAPDFPLLRALLLRFVTPDGPTPPQSLSPSWSPHRRSAFAAESPAQARPPIIFRSGTIGPPPTSDRQRLNYPFLCIPEKENQEDLFFFFFSPP